MGASSVLEFVGKIPCDCKHCLKQPVPGSEIVGSAGIDEEARACMKIKREETGERKGGGSLGPVSEVVEKGNLGVKQEKYRRANPLPRLHLGSFRSLVSFFSPTPIFVSFFPQCGAWTQARTAEPEPRLGRRNLLSFLSTACSSIPAPGKPSDWSDLTSYINTFQLWVVSVTQRNRGIHDNFYVQRTYL